MDYVPRKYIHPEYDEQKLKALMNLQASIPEKKMPCAFVIFDDCLNSPKQWNSKPLISLCTQLRHYKVFVIMSTQWCNLIHPTIRSNCFGSFIFFIDGKNQLKSLFENYGQCFNSFNDFKKYMFANTGN